MEDMGFIVLVYWWVLFLVFSLMAVVFTLKKKPRYAPSLEYVKARLKVQRWLQTRDFSGQTKMDQILRLLRLVL